MDDDLRIIQRVLDGDVDAFRQLVERYQAMLLTLIGNLVRDRNEREDLAQDTLLSAYVHLRSFDPRAGKFSTWLLTIARNKCLNRLKKRTPQPMEPLPQRTDRRDAADALSDTEFFVQLDRALDTLPVDQRMAFVLAEFQGLSHEQIGRIEGTPVGTIKSRISRAKARLRSLLSNTPE
jgi:RNA polymerase sigma-70 factor (ECF subfamily)